MRGLSGLQLSDGPGEYQMQKPELRELIAFTEVARQLSFTRAAAVVGISPPTFSQTLRGLEEKLGVRLLTRTTRSVSLTEAGAELLAKLEPVLEGLDMALDGLNSFRDATGGRVRILASRTAAMIMVGPLIGRFLATHPGIELEMLVDDLHLDLVEHRIDAGIQVGERIEKDMIAVRLVDPFEEVLMASPGYLAGRTMPEKSGGFARPLVRAAAILLGRDCTAVGSAARRRQGGTSCRCAFHRQRSPCPRHRYRGRSRGRSRA